jgi:hypothetical protein
VTTTQPTNQPTPQGIPSASLLSEIAARGDPHAVMLQQLRSGRVRPSPDAASVTVRLVCGTRAGQLEVPTWAAAAGGGGGGGLARLSVPRYAAVALKGKHLAEMRKVVINKTYMQVGWLGRLGLRLEVAALLVPPLDSTNTLNHQPPTPIHPPGQAPRPDRRPVGGPDQRRDHQGGRTGRRGGGGRRGWGGGRGRGGGRAAGVDSACILIDFRGSCNPTCC